MWCHDRRRRTLLPDTLNLIDIKARNEAIEIMWLRTYLDFSPTRPKWAKITDLIIDVVKVANVGDMDLELPLKGFKQCCPPHSNVCLQVQGRHLRPGKCISAMPAGVSLVKLM